MKLHYPRIDDNGRIIWRFHKKPIGAELYKSGVAWFDTYADAHITRPISVEQVQKAVVFARDWGLEIEPNVDLGLSVEEPEALVAYFYANRLAMSMAEMPLGKAATSTRKPLSPFFEAGVQYATQTQRCFIADPEESDRQIVALASVDQLDAYPCVLVCREEERKSWIQQIQTYLPEDLQILIGDEIGLHPPTRSIWVIDYRDLAQDIQMPLLTPVSVIVDHAHFIKNPLAKRTKWVVDLVRGVKYRFLVTDFPVNISPSDLSEPLQILGKLTEFDKLGDFLKQASPNPLDNRGVNIKGTTYERKLAALYRKLRWTCLVRRCYDPGLRSAEHLQHITLSKIPEGFFAGEIRSDLRYFGLQKVTSATVWLDGFLNRNPGKVLVFAHHNDVVEELSAALDIPAIYGKVTDEKKRASLAAEFADPDGIHALIVASDVELTWPLGQVAALVFVELLITPRQFYGMIDHLLGPDAVRSIPVHFLYAGHSLDWEALKRLEMRLEDYDQVMDGHQPVK